MLANLRLVDLREVTSKSFESLKDIEQLAKAKTKKQLTASAM
ncbi:MAG: hypothetical protein QW630_06520 [Sulfolobales archaeon]